MKKIISSTLGFLLLLAAGCATTSAKSDKPTNVTVSFKDPDKYTDARSTFGFGTDENYLSILGDHLKQVASKQLAAGQKLEVTFTDVDLAGEFLPTSRMDQIRVIKELYLPRLTLTFKLTDASGLVVKEGERRLTDMNFMSNLGLIGRNEPLFHDKALLTDWVRKEFKP